jgi:predicted dehydrogenase
MTVLRAAIIGPGRIASTYDDEVPVKRPPDFFTGEMRHSGVYTVHPTNHAQAYLTSPGYELVAFAGRSQDRINAFADRWGITPYNDAVEMLAAVKPDVVSICTQSAEKAGLTIAAAEAGVRAIIVEKAMATNMAEADAMIEACETSGTLLTVNHPYRFSPMSRAARALIDDGEIGDVGAVSGFSRGGMIHVGTHTFDMLRYFGGDVAEVSAWGPVEDAWSDRPADGMLRFVSGKTGFFSHQHDAFPGFDIRGTGGQIGLAPVTGESWIVRTSRLDEQRGYPLVGKRAPIEVTHTMSVTQRLLSDVREALLNNGPHLSTGRDGAAALEIGIAALVSAKESRPVSLPLANRSISIPNR